MRRGGGGWRRRRVLGWSGGTKINTISKPPMWPVSIAKHFTPAPTQPRKHTHTHTICPTSQTVTMIHTIDNTHQTHPDTYTQAARCYQSTNVSLKVIDTPQKHSDNLISVFWLTDGNLLELLGDLLLYSVLSHFLQPMSRQKLLNHNPKACLLLDYGPFTTISQSFFLIDLKWSTALLWSLITGYVISVRYTRLVPDSVVLLILYGINSTSC